MKEERAKNESTKRVCAVETKLIFGRNKIV
jgi:hypothetical protein